MTINANFEITGVQWSVFGGAFNVSRLKELHPEGKSPTMLILATWDTSGLKPCGMLLPHQLYTKTARDIMERYLSAEKLYVLPVWDAIWTEVIIPPEEEDELRRQLWELENERLKKVYNNA